MEIAPVPHRTTRNEWRRLALGLLVLTPVVLLVLLPAVLGLDRYVITDHAASGGAGRGSVVMAREVPPADLAAGDVISFSPSVEDSDAQATTRLTREIVDIDGNIATTSGGVRVPLGEEPVARVWLSIPWIGYPFVIDGGWVLLVMAAAGALTLAVLAGRRRPVVTIEPAGIPRPELPVA